VLTRYSNRPDVLDDLTHTLDKLRKLAQSADGKAMRFNVRSEREAERRCLKDRLTSDDMASLYAAYRTGTRQGVERPSSRGDDKLLES
jgi:hypothetical protein